MKITCPNCKCSGDAPDEMIGKPVQCSGCNRVFEVPPAIPSKQETGIQLPQQRIETGIQLPQQRAETGIQLPRPAERIKEEGQSPKVSEATAKRLVGIFTAVFGVFSVMCCMMSWSFVFAFDAGVPNTPTLILVYSGWAFPFVCWLSILAAWGLKGLHRHRASVAVFGLPVLNICVIAFAIIWLQWAFGGSFRNQQFFDEAERKHQAFLAAKASPPMTGGIHFEKTTQVVKQGQDVTFIAVRGSIGDIGFEKRTKTGITYSRVSRGREHEDRRFGVSLVHTEGRITFKAHSNATVGLYSIFVYEPGKRDNQDILLRVEVAN